MSEPEATSKYIAAVNIQLEVGTSKGKKWKSKVWLCVAKGIKLCLWGKDSDKGKKI